MFISFRKKKKKSVAEVAPPPTLNSADRPPPYPGYISEISANVCNIGCSHCTVYRPLQFKFQYCSLCVIITYLKEE